MRVLTAMLRPVVATTLVRCHGQNQKTNRQIQFEITVYII